MLQSIKRESICTMERLQRQIKGLLSLGLMALWLTGKAQSDEQKADAWVEMKPYELGTYMGANRTINLMVMVRQPSGISVKIKNGADEVLHELYMKKSPRTYHYRLHFEDSQAGLYKLEISDGRTTRTHQIEVVDIPATEGQRYITFTSPSNQ